MPESLGEGVLDASSLGGLGTGSVIEPGLRIFGAAAVVIGAEVYVGHDCFFRAYPEGPLDIGDGSWIGPGCFINSFGGVRIGHRVGLGPGVCILSSAHDLSVVGGPIIDRPLKAARVEIGDGADLGARSVILPGVRVGRMAQVGAGAMVTRDVPEGARVAGSPARILPTRASLSRTAPAGIAPAKTAPAKTAPAKTAPAKTAPAGIAPEDES